MKHCRFCLREFGKVVRLKDTELACPTHVEMGLRTLWHDVFTAPEDGRQDAISDSRTER